MQYLLLIADDESSPALQPEARKAMLAEYFALNDELKSKKQYVAGDALEPTSTATTVRVRDGKVMTVDGPFAETKEQLGGYYLIDVDNLDEALAVAAKIPAARTGCIEVRPLLDPAKYQV